MQDLFSLLYSHITLSLYLFQGALSKQGHTFSNTLKSFSPSCYFLVLSCIGKRKTEIYIVLMVIVASNTLWDIPTLQVFFQDIFMQLVFFSWKTFVWSVIFYWILKGSIHMLSHHNSIKLTNMCLSHQGLFRTFLVHTHTHTHMQTQTPTLPPFSPAETVSL